jgi:hypothetical protein
MTRGGQASKLWRKEWYGGRGRVLTLARSCCGWSSVLGSDLRRVLKLRDNDVPWLCCLATYRSNAPPYMPPTVPCCRISSAAVVASASLSMEVCALVDGEGTEAHAAAEERRTRQSR